MCTWCTEHGKGKKWYHRVEAYIRNFNELDEQLQEWNGKYRASLTELWGLVSLELDVIKSRMSPRLEKLANNDWEAGLAAKHSGQIVTLEEAKEMCEGAGDDGFVKLACVCRKYKRGGKGLEADNNYTLAVSAFANMFKEHPERLWKEERVETVSVEEAKEHLEKWSDNGCCHTASYVGSPAFMSKLCQCEYPVCIWLQWRLDWGLTGILRKGHYVASVDMDKCIGCAKCTKTCQFKAISYSPSYEKAILKQDKCFGCGECMRVCPEEAITMLEREFVQALREEW
jgi:ferredoxin